MKFYERHKPIVFYTVLAIVLVLLSLVLAYWVTHGLLLSERLSAMQLSLSAVAFVGVVIALMIAIAQFRKSVAKPLIKVAFDEKGKQEAKLIIINNNPGELPLLWIINEGNKISRYFQIDFIIPKGIVNPRGKELILDIPHISLEEFGDDYIFSYTNEGRNTLFVNKPCNDTDFNLNYALGYRKCNELFRNNFILKYNIYSDWGEPQKGELKVIIEKQEAL